MSEPFPFSSPPQASHFILGRNHMSGADRQTPTLSSPVPSPYFSPYSSSFQSPTLSNPFTSPHSFGAPLPTNFPIHDPYYNGGTPSQSPQLYSAHSPMIDSPRMPFPSGPWSPTTSWASTMFPAGMGSSWLGVAGMGFPSQPRPKLTTTLWEDESTVCYQVDAKGICVARRQDNDMVNGTKLLNVTGMSRGKRDGILKNEKGRIVVKVGAMHLKGVWITFQRAKALAAQFKIADLLYPLFTDDPSPFLYNPHCQPSPVPNSHAYSNSLGSLSAPSKPQLMYHNATSPLSMNSSNMYTSHSGDLLSSPSLAGNENSDSVNGSPIIYNQHYSKAAHEQFVSPASPLTQESTKSATNTKKRSFDELEDEYYDSLGRTMSNTQGRGFTAFPSPLSLSPSSLPSPSINPSNSNFQYNPSPPLSKRVKLLDSDYPSNHSPQITSHQYRHEPAHADSFEDSYRRSITAEPSLQHDSLGLLFETLSPPQSEAENFYDSGGVLHSYDNEHGS